MSKQDKRDLVIVEEDDDKDKEKNELEASRRNNRILKLIESEHIVDLDAPLPSFKGQLITTTLSKKGLKEMSLRTHELLTSADIILYEDNKDAENLLQMLFEDEYEENKDIIDEVYDLEIRKFEGYSQIEQKKGFDILKETKIKENLRQMYQKEEFSKMVSKSRKILQETDAFKAYDSIDIKSEGIYNSLPKKSKKSKKYGIDQSYVDHLRKQVYESKVRRRRGLILSTKIFDKNNYEETENGKQI